jgi:hypothetical protein
VDFSLDIVKLKVSRFLQLVIIFVRNFISLHFLRQRRSEEFNREEVFERLRLLLPFDDAICVVSSCPFLLETIFLSCRCTEDDAAVRLCSMHRTRWQKGTSFICTNY